MTTGTTRKLLVGFCLLGLLASAASAYVHYQLINDPTYTSFCDINETFNCESVYRSAYGSVGGVPVAVAGVLWFALALLVVAAVPPESAAGYLFVLSTIALAVVMYLGYASFVVLKTYCVYCLMTYIAVIGVFVVSGISGPSRLALLPGAAASDLRRLARHPVALTLALLYVAGAASLIAFFPREEGRSPVAVVEEAPAVLPAVQDDQLAQFHQWIEAQPRVPITEATDGAKVLILKFNDYQCPPCRQTYSEYKPIIARYQAQYPGQVKFVTKDFPLEAECNTGGVHVAACEAAAAVRLARSKGKADALEAWLFENQPSMSPDLVRTGLKQVAGVTDFDAQYAKTLEQVRADVALGRQLGVASTPTFFVNGVKIVGGLRPQFFDAAIAYELKKAGGRSRKQMTECSRSAPKG